MLLQLMLMIFLQLAAATPPACFLKCINEQSHSCSKNQADVACICGAHEDVNRCITVSCEGAEFYSARDHFKGTCIEHRVDFEVSETEFDSSVQDDGSDGSDGSDESDKSDDERSDNETPEDIPHAPKDKDGDDVVDCNKVKHRSISDLSPDELALCIPYILGPKEPSHSTLAQGKNGIFNNRKKSKSTSPPKPKPQRYREPNHHVPNEQTVVKPRRPKTTVRYHPPGRQDRILHRRSTIT